VTCKDDEAQQKRIIGVIIEVTHFLPLLHIASSINALISHIPLIWNLSHCYHICLKM